jgi:formylmethanofuran dehydrogenase subunit E
MSEFDVYLKKAQDFHGHVCAGIALGTRISLAAMKELGLKPGVKNKSLIVYVEIDRCMTDAVQAITGCSLGRRSLKHVDYGRFAVTLVNLNTGKAVRATVKQVFSSKADKNETLNIIATSPDDELVTLQAVVVDIPEFDLPGSPRKTIICHACGERVVDGRDVEKGGVSLCRACAGDAYYSKAAATPRDNPAAQNAS